MWAEASTPQTTSFPGRLTEVRTPEVATRLQVRLRVGRLTLGLTVADRWEWSQATGLPAWRLALHLHHRDLHLSDPQLPAPQAAALTPEAWADTAPEEIAAYLRTTCRRFANALGRRKGTPYHLSALLYPAHHPHPAQQTPPEGWASFQDAHLAAPDEATATRMGLTDVEA